MKEQAPEQFRVEGSDTIPGHPMNGLFLIPLPTPGKRKIKAFCIASDGAGWDHVSVTLRDHKGLVKRTPTWMEMDLIKRYFWNDDEAVMQLHPPRQDWINNHPYCLHLWKPQDQEIPRPHQLMVGLPQLNRKR